MERYKLTRIDKMSKLKLKKYFEQSQEMDDIVNEAEAMAKGNYNIKTKLNTEDYYKI